jgi:hypothetical protein
MFSLIDFTMLVLNTSLFLKLNGKVISEDTKQREPIKSMLDLVFQA